MIEDFDIKRAYVSRNVIKRGDLSHLSLEDRNKEYLKLIQPIQKLCIYCDKNILRTNFTTHKKTKIHQKNKQIYILTKQLLQGVEPH